jgi:hypothetical protein
MFHNPLFRRMTAGVVVILAVLCGTTVAQQVVPASGTPEKPAARSAIAISTGSVAPPKSTALTPRSKDQGTDKGALIAQALDQLTDLDIKDKVIGEAFDLLGEQTGIPIVIEPGTLDQLPQGSRTKLSATIKKKCLRTSLAALLQPIALRFDVEDEHLVIRPTPPLRRIPQRATWQELDLLKKLATNRWSDDFAKSLKFQFQRTPLTLADVNRNTLLELAAKVGEGTASEVLELATNQYGWTWHPDGDLIVILPKTRQVELQLEQRVTADYSEMSVQDTLVDLAEKAGVPLRCDPGALASLSPFVAERFNLKVVNTPIRQAFELLAGQTGLGYYIEPEGVRITASALSSAGGPTVNPAAHAPDATGNIPQATYDLLRSNSIVANIELPPSPDGRKFVIVVRRGDLPQDLRDLINAVIADSVEPIRIALKAATRPHD